MKKGNVGQERACAVVGNVYCSYARNLDFRNSIETDLLGGLRYVTSVYTWAGLEKGEFQRIPRV